MRSLALLLLAAGANAAPLVVLAHRPGEPRTTVHVVPAGARALPPAFAVVDHLPDAVVRGAVLPGGDVVVVADRTPSRDLSFAAVLLHVSRRGRVTVLADRVAHAARPLVAQGRVFVERGRPGPDPTEDDARAGRLRIDDLTVDEVGLDGRARTLLAWRGYTAHLAAATTNEVIVYRVGPAGADLVALHLAQKVNKSGESQLRPLALVAPFARDFVLDGQGRLLYAGRDGDDWTLERLDLRRGGREILARERDRTPEVPARITQRYPEDGGMPHLLVDGARVPAPDGVRLEAAGFVP